jgi:nucleoid-associated protein YgaU
LRNEAPRPLFTEPRASVAPPAAPRVVQNNVPARYWGPPPGETASAASAVLPAEYERDSAIRETAQTALAASTATLPVEPKTAVVPFIAPPPSQPLEEQDSPRTHIIIDGDSLPKLAGRYLDDPRREREIYELNRHVLSDPELLPIGAELVIPRRSQVRDSDNYLPQSALPGSLAVHAAARGGLVPVRPVPSGSEAMPRAQLARPLPAP